LGVSEENGQRFPFAIAAGTRRQYLLRERFARAALNFCPPRYEETDSKKNGGEI